MEAPALALTEGRHGTERQRESKQRQLLYYERPQTRERAARSRKWPSVTEKQKCWEAHERGLCKEAKGKARDHQGVGAARAGADEEQVQVERKEPEEHAQHVFALADPCYRLDTQRVNTEQDRRHEGNTWATSQPKDKKVQKGGIEGVKRCVHQVMRPG